MWSIVHCFVTPRHLIHLVQLTDHTRGELPYKCDGDARRLILGCKLQILVSLRVSLSTARKEIYKKNALSDHTEISLRGQFKLEPHPHWSPLGG